MSSDAAFNPDQLKAATRTQWDQSGSGWNNQAPVIRAWLEDTTRQGWVGPNELLIGSALSEGPRDIPEVA